MAIVNAFAWESYTEIQSLKLRYPNSALGALQVSARQFNSLPTRAYDLLLMRVQVPSNYNPLTRVYTGTWDGTFTVAWTDNPAWIFREMATHTRWGLGRYIASAQVNKWLLYKIAQYCDGMVPDGFGGTEPRFTCNLYLQTREQARKVLQDLAAVFRAIAFWAGGELQTVQDAPSDPVMLFTPANVVDGNFDYQGQSGLQRHSVFIVHYNDLTQLGKRTPEVYAPDDLVARYGIRELELSPIGVSSRGQAQRLARWAAYSEEMEAEVVSFRVGAEGQLALPGQVFEISDPTEAGERLGGRIRAATSSEVTLDAAVTLHAGETYTLTVQYPDPAASNAFKTQERAVTSAPGSTNVIDASPAFSVAPPAQGTWLLASTAVQPTLWRCMGVSEVKGEDQYEVLGVAHNPGKYDLIELGVALKNRPISRLTLIPPAPTSLSYTETTYRYGASYRSRLTVSWSQTAPGLLYALSWRHNGGPWTDEPLSSGNCLDIDGLSSGTVELQVRSQNSLGRPSEALVGTALVVGRTLGLGIKVNTAAFAGATDYGECYIHGIDLAGNPVDSAGAVLYNGVAVQVPAGALYTSEGPQKGWIVWDRAGATFPNPLGARPYAFVRKAGGLWQYDTGTGWATWTQNGTRVLIGSLETANADTNVAPGVTQAVVWSEAIDPDALVGLGDTALWDGVKGIPYATIFNNDDSVALGFNPTFSDWAFGSYPAGWALWSGSSPIKETSIVRVGTYAVRWNGVSAGGNEGMTCLANLSATPLPLGTFLSGSVDIYLQARTSGVPGLLVRLYRNSSLTVYTDTIVPAESTSTGGWQRTPWSARVPAADRIYGIRIYVMATWGSSPLAFAGSVVFDNLRFMLCDNTTDNKAVTIDTDGTLGGAGGGQVTITGLGYLGDLNATRDVTLVARGICSVSGNSATGTGGGSWGSGDVSSKEAYTGGAFCSAEPSVTGSVMFGLNQDPATDQTYTGLDRAIWANNGDFYVYEAGASKFGPVAFSGGDVFSIAYEGASVQYLRNGAEFYTSEGVVLSTYRYCFDSAFFNTASLSNIRFGPLSKVADIGTGQVAPGAITDSVLVTAAGPIAAVGVYAELVRSPFGPYDDAVEIDIEVTAQANLMWGTTGPANMYAEAYVDVSVGTDSQVVKSDTWYDTNAHQAIVPLTHKMALAAGATGYARAMGKVTVAGGGAPVGDWVKMTLRGVVRKR